MGRSIARQARLEYSFKNDANQSDARRLRDCRGLQVAARGLSISRHQVQAQLCLAGRADSSAWVRWSSASRLPAMSSTSRIETPKINDPLGRGIRAGGDEFLPILQRSPDARRKRRRRHRTRNRSPGLTTRHRAPICAQPRDQVRHRVPRRPRKRATISPPASPSDRSTGAPSCLRKTFARADQSDLRRRSARSNRAMTSVSAKPVSRNTVSHCARLQQRLLRTQIAIGEAPPSAR